MTNALSRRTFLRAAGVGLALPALDAMVPVTLRAARAAEATTPPRRMITICTTLGIHTPYLFPTTTGRDYAATPYLELLKDHRRELTVFSGMSHPLQAGANGHSSEMTFLTAVQNPGLSGFRNSISVDQLAAEKIGFHTRFPSLVLSTTGGSQSYTRSGIPIPSEHSPSKTFAKLFLDGKPAEIEAQREQLRQGRSILDAVADESKRLERRVSAADRDKLDEYFTSVREMENRIAMSQEWVKRPKPKVDAQQPVDIKVDADLINKMKLVFDLVPLALQTDSTRVISITVQGRGDVPQVPGVSVDHHGLSHHGQDPDKLQQLKLVESEIFKGLNNLLTGLKSKKEAGGTLLDNTSMLFGSNLGNANSHDSRNLPIVFAGGGFKHAGHVAYDLKNNKPMSNLFVSMLQKMGIEEEKFGSSTGTISEI